jgi:tyrosyl-tRNA synthetase
MTSPYRFYQFWINTDDADVVRYLKFFSLRPRAEIEELEEAVREEPHKRAAQSALAEEVTRRVHGETGLAGAVQASRVLFGGEITGLGADQVGDIFADVPSSTVSTDALSAGGVSLIDLLMQADLASSKGDARRSIEGGGIYVNNVRVTDVERQLRTEDAIEGRFLVLRKGKKSYHLAEVTA